MSNLDTKAVQLAALPLDRGMQYLVNEGYRIIGHPILVHDMDYKVVTYTENIVIDDPIWIEFVTNGMVGDERKEFYKNEDFLDAAANAKRTAYLFSDKLKYDRIIGKIFNGDGIQIGVAVAVIKELRPFEADIHSLFERFCVLLDKSIAGSDYYLRYGQEFQEKLISELIAGTILDKGIYMAHVESIYMNLKDNLFLAVADITRCPLAHAGLTYFRDLFKRAQPRFKYAIYEGYIVMIISSDSETFDIKRDLHALNDLFEKNNIHVGISSCFENLYELNRYYAEAVNALTKAQAQES